MACSEPVTEGEGTRVVIPRGSYHAIWRSIGTSTSSHTSKTHPVYELKYLLVAATTWTAVRAETDRAPWPDHLVVMAMDQPSFTPGLSANFSVGGRLVEGSLAASCATVAPLERVLRAGAHEGVAPRPAAAVHSRRAKGRRSQGSSRRSRRRGPRWTGSGRRPGRYGCASGLHGPTAKQPRG